MRKLQSLKRGLCLMLALAAVLVAVNAGEFAFAAPSDSWARVNNLYETIAIYARDQGITEIGSLNRGQTVKLLEKTAMGYLKIEFTAPNQTKASTGYILAYCCDMLTDDEKNDKQVRYVYPTVNFKQTGVSLYSGDEAKPSSFSDFKLLEGYNAKLISEGSTYHRISVGGLELYVKTTDVIIKQVPNEVKARDAWTVNDNTTFLKTVSNKGDKHEALSAGAKLSIYEEIGAYCRAVSGKTEGYVLKRDISFVPIATPEPTAGKPTPDPITPTPAPTPEPTPTPLPSDVGIVRTDVLTVRKSASSGSDAIATLYKYSQIKILEPAGAFSHVDLGGGIEGYVATSMLSKEQLPDTWLKSGVVAATSAINLRERPLASTKVVGQLAGGSIVAIKYATGNWYYVNQSDKWGFVQKEYITTLLVSSGVVNAAGLNVRREPSSSSAVVTSLDKNVAFEVDRVGMPFSRMKHINTKGFVASNYVTMSIAKGKIIGDKINIRSGPSATHKMIGSLKKGDLVTIIGPGMFYAIDYNGVRGYVSAEFVDITSFVGASPEPNTISAIKNLNRPITVLNVGEESAVPVRKGPGSGETLGYVYGQTVGVTVLRNETNGYTLIRARDYPNSAPFEGYVPTKLLKVIVPNPEMSIIIDKSVQKLWIYQKGKVIREMLVSTGSPSNETPPGEYVIGLRKPSFISGNVTALYALRINFRIYIHRVPHNSDGNMDWSIAQLGRKASHGCIRVPVDDSKWMYNNVPKGIKVIIVE